MYNGYVPERYFWSSGFLLKKWIPIGSMTHPVSNVHSLHNWHAKTPSSYTTSIYEIDMKTNLHCSFSSGPYPPMAITEDKKHYLSDECSSVEE